MLTVSIAEIPEAGLKWKERMGSAWSTPLLNGQFEVESRTIDIDISLNAANRNVMVHACMKGCLGFRCSRCAERKTYELNHSFVHVFVSKTRHSALPEDFEASGEAEFTFFEGKKVEIEPVAAEELVVALPETPLCSVECRGLCPECGTNLNDGSCDCVNDNVDPRWEKLREIEL